MASIIVRGLDKSVKNRLVAQAKQHGRSTEAEVREIITRAVSMPHVGLALMQVAREFGGVEDLQLPNRDDVARVADLS